MNIKNFIPNFSYIIESFNKLEVSWILAWYDVKLKYRRTKLGPLWLTLTLILDSIVLSIIFSKLFRENFFDYFPYVFSGRIAWNLIAGIIKDAAVVIFASKDYMVNNALPASIFLNKICIKNAIIFAHACIFAFIFAAISHDGFTIIYILLLPFSTLLCLLVLLPYALILSIFAARFRDISILVPYFLQIIFYVTPIMWKVKFLPEHWQFIVYYNPLSSMVEVIRSSILGGLPHAKSIEVLMVSGVIGWALGLSLYSATKNKLCYWML